MRTTLAKLSSAPSLSAVHRGVAFENRSLALLQTHMSMSLRRVGGRSDGGVDLQGWWWLPHSGASAQLPRRRLRVLAQCKAEKKSLGPHYIREMEGVLHRYGVKDVVSDVQETYNQQRLEAEDEHISEAPGSQVVALVISESRFTPATMIRAQSSPMPFFLLRVPPLLPQNSPTDTSDDASTEPDIGSAYMNNALQSLVQRELEVRMEHSLQPGEPATFGLWWKGEPLQNWVPDTPQFLQHASDIGK